MNRNQKILAVVAALIIVLYITGVATQKGSDGPPPDPTQNELVQTLGRWFGGADPVALEEVSGACLSGSTLAFEGSCVITVKPSDKDLRELALKPDTAVHLTTRAPHDDSTLDKDLEPGKLMKVAVDDKGTDIKLTCSKCTIAVGDSDG
ncbi:MAG TPA: hypothetical protein VFC19_29880 [Candidatus Limnocylindrales bacterium]|nr:hypothetical protein [Candidatus Limnocylindrales bacterium]